MNKYKITVKYDDNTSFHFIGMYKNAIEAAQVSANKLKHVKKNINSRTFCRLIHDENN